MECNQDKNEVNCTCTYMSCDRRGICCECIAYHRSIGQVPGCLFPSEVEKTYDRSIKRFVTAWTE